MQDLIDVKRQNGQNPYLIMGFWEFAITATLMTAFFPWSLLFCVFFYGLENTKLLIIALLHDLLKTAMAVLSIIVPLTILIVMIFIFFVG